MVMSFIMRLGEALPRAFLARKTRDDCVIRRKQMRDPNVQPRICLFFVQQRWTIS
jgi:hypothetical protein